jgi:hypothetical protein
MVANTEPRGGWPYKKIVPITQYREYSQQVAEFDNFDDRAFAGLQIRAVQQMPLIPM